MDTGDTGKDTGFQHYWSDEHGHVSASELANETGGFGCNQIGFKPLVGLLVVVLIILCIRQFNKRTNYY